MQVFFFRMLLAVSERIVAGTECLYVFISLGGCTFVSLVACPMSFWVLCSSLAFISFMSFGEGAWWCYHLGMRVQAFTIIHSFFSCDQKKEQALLFEIADFVLLCSYFLHPLQPILTCAITNSFLGVFANSSVYSSVCF